jgi:copper(I)-binding protein
LKRQALIRSDRVENKFINNRDYKMKTRLTRATGAVLLMLTAFSATAGGIQVTDPWVRAAPPNAPALAAFMKLENHTGAEISIVDARTSLAVARVELHRTTMVDGVMKMTPQTAIPVAAHSATLLQPGSWHIMLISPQKVPLAGESVELTLLFSDGSEQKVDAIVRKGKMKMSEGHDMTHMAND